MSKSLGNVVDPVGLVDNIFSGKPDPLRYFLLRTGKLNSDSPFSLDGFKTCYNNELVGNLGNLISRIFKKYSSDQIALIPEIDQLDSLNLSEKLQNFEEAKDEFYERFQFGHVADLAMHILSETNRYVSQIEPWKFKESRDQQHFASQISYILKRTTSVLSPLIPESSETINSILKGSRELSTLGGGLFPRLLNRG